MDTISQFMNVIFFLLLLRFQTHEQYYEMRKKNENTGQEGHGGKWNKSQRNGRNGNEILLILDKESKYLSLKEILCELQPKKL